MRKVTGPRKSDDKIRAREACYPADILFTILAYPQAVEAMALGSDGFLDHMNCG